MSTIQTYDLTVKRLLASMLFDDVAEENLQVQSSRRVEMLARQLTAALEVPSRVLQQDRVIASYPETWWDALKARLGWKHARTQVRLTEWLCFPKVVVPRGFRDQVRIYVAPKLNLAVYKRGAEIFNDQDLEPDMVPVLGDDADQRVRLRNPGRRAGSSQAPPVPSPHHR